ncbi:ORF_015L [Scale drop disease virus]|uniref:ORF_015L n=1 Tax=Scale drop disease virus TaxID=1697349 RepID=A0A0K1L726_9VIRU|nr:ORF_015L [Scale drop disease virus]AKU37430.1 ORF_015L [Scale drop disease virus]UNH60768.1 putative serine/threonine-protein kinase [Scale drop disease virus]
MSSRKKLCNKFRRSGYAVNPITKRPISPTGDVSKTMQQVCSEKNLCRQYNDDPSYNPWTHRSLTAASPKHRYISGICSGGRANTPPPPRPPRRRRQVPAVASIDKQLETQWATSQPNSQLPYKLEACARYTMEPHINPFTDKPLKRHSQLEDALYRECEDDIIKDMECGMFQQNPTRNPETNRPISATGPIANSLRRRCAGWSPSSPSQPASPSLSPPVPARSSLSPPVPPRSTSLGSMSRSFNPSMTSTPLQRSPARARADTLRRYIQGSV